MNDTSKAELDAHKHCVTCHPEIANVAQPEAETARLRAERDDALGGYREAAKAADRFRDVLSECLGHADENPGDDVLVRELREHFGRTGPEPTRWRDFCTGARAIVDQINADRRVNPPGRPA